ncbi:MAG: DUF58 domain-containing protein [Actinobacteria bacterium]|nr:DUF58 domain-containing protein [Actinomycetota bacterium]
MPTKKTYVFIALSLVLFLIAANLQSGWIYLISFYLIFEILFSFFHSRRILRHATIERVLPVRSESKIPFNVVYSFKNMPPAFLIDEEWGDRYQAFGEEGLLQFQATLNRGIYDFSGFNVKTYLPAGFFVANKKIPQKQRMIVWPEIDREQILLAREFIAGGMIEAGVQKKSGEEYSGIREYQQGDALKKVHWKKTALYKKILVRDEVETFEKRAVVIVDNRRKEELDYFEDLLSVSRTVIESLIDIGFVVNMACFVDGNPSVFSGNAVEFNDILAGLKPEENFEGLSFNENYNSRLFVIITSDPEDFTYLCSFSDTVLILVGEKQAPNCFSRVIRVLSIEGKRRWLF